MKKQAMRRAWEIYRTLTGDRIAKLSAALKQAWAEVKNAACEVINGWNVSKLIKAGANRCTKYGKDRIYLSNIGAALMGLETDHYKSGHLCGAWLNDEKISNGEASRVMSAYSDAYINLTTGEIFGCRSAKYNELFIEKLTTAFAA